MSRPLVPDTEIDELRQLTPPTRARPARGQVLAGRCVIGTPLGQGAVGQVFQAYDRATKTRVAIKVVRPEVAGNGSALERLGREVHHAREVQHPNVCRIFELIESDGFTWFTMELATRGSLRATLNRKRPRPLALRMADACAVAAGLAAIHAAGIIHRDLKPENLLRMADGRLVVSDFGLAQPASRRQGSRAGTRGYIAPEVLAGDAATARSDVWALGVVLREIVFGSRAASASGGGSPVERALWEVCAWCMQPSPRARPADGAAVLARLQALEGEPLGERLHRGPMAASDALRVAGQVLEALAARTGPRKVHGAVCPANIFLRGDPASARLLDPQLDGALAETEAPPVYRSPEQARGEGRLDPRADIFAMGCVLLECLTGRAPHQGRPTLQTLARRSVGEGVDLSSAELTPGVKRLLRRMLEPDRTRRAADAGALARELTKLAGSADRAAPRDVVPSAPEALVREQRLTWRVGLRVGRGRLSVTAPARRVVETFGAKLERLGPGSLLITMPRTGPPSDLATLAARCALAMKAHFATAAIGVGVGDVGSDGDPPAKTTKGLTALLKGAGSGVIHLDETSAALLAGRFEISAGKPAGLLGERGLTDRPRTILGKPVLCVGRDRELAALMGLWEECTNEQTAHAVLVTAPAGGGKSRLRHELVERIRSAAPSFLRLVGRGDALRAGSPFAMLGPAIRTLAGLVGGEPAPIQQERLLVQVSRHVAPEIAGRVAAFLGEIADVPFDDTDLPSLRAARQDPRLMADQTLCAWLDYLEAACNDQPVLLVLEDLHWGDAPSVEFVDAALRTLRDSPLMVLALSRPELDEKFPGLWAERNLQRISLPPLSAKSCHRVIQQVFPDLPESKSAWIVERADGNPFYLEELLRALSRDGTPDATSRLPDTVLGMVQARFDDLGDSVRRVLRAASVFGQTFDVADIAALVEEPAAVPQALEVLEAREVVLVRRAAGAGERVFRHALLREAAYQMLTDEDRQRAHRRAGEFLESRGERDAIVLVEHFERGGLPARAAHHCQRAAAQAVEAHDLPSAFERVARGIRNGAQGEALGSLRLIEAQARFWMGEFSLGEAAARESIALARGPVRLHAASELIAALGQQGRFAEIEAMVETARSWPECHEDLAGWHYALVRAAGYLPQGGRIALTEQLLAEVESALPAGHSILSGMSHYARGLMLLGPQPAGAARQFELARVAFEACADVRRSIEASCNIASALGATGQLEESERHLRALLPSVARMNLKSLEPMLEANLGMIRADLGAVEEAQGLVEQGLVTARRQGDPRVEGYCHQYLALIATRLGDFAAAEAHAHAALSRAGESYRPTAMAALAGALLGQGRVAEALAQAQEANALLEAMGYVEDGEALIRLSLAECLLAAGDEAGARQAADRAHRRLLDRADAIDEPAWRTSFLTALPDHRRTVEVARELGLVERG